LVQFNIMTHNSAKLCNLCHVNKYRMILRNSDKLVLEPCQVLHCLLYWYVYLNVQDEPWNSVTFLFLEMGHLK